MKTHSAMPRGRVSRVLWPIGWALLLIAAAAATYAMLVLGGR